MKKVYVFLAEGFEEMEAVTPIDLLRRAGVDAKLVSVTGNRAVTGAHGVTYLADLLFEEIEEDADMLVLPGGLPGTTNLQAHEGLTKLLLKQHEAHKWVAAICAAPMVLGALGIVKDRHATIYPGIEDKLIGAAPLTDEVVVDGNVITSRAPGTAIPFAERNKPLPDRSSSASDTPKDRPSAYGRSGISQSMISENKTGRVSSEKEEQSVFSAASRTAAKGRPNTYAAVSGV